MVNALDQSGSLITVIHPDDARLPRSENPMLNIRL